MKRFSGILCLLLLGQLLWSQSETRIALLIGNSKYRYSTALDNPRNDVDSLYQVLRQTLGFEVIRATDADQAAMQTALDKFERRIQQVKRNGKRLVTLFYYSGHGMQVNGTNYLLPIRSKIVSTADLTYRAINLQQTLDRLESHGNFLNIIMLDACRNNPLTKSLGRSKGAGDLFEGYAPPQSEGKAGMFISFATAPRQVADSGDRRYSNSPYVLSFLQHVRTPNLSVEELFRLVNKSVVERTQNTQKPWTQSSFYEDFAFIKRAEPLGSNKRIIPESMILIPGGSFQMGSKDGKDDEKNIHSVLLSPFMMDKTEVTFAQFDAFCVATGRQKPNDEGWGRGNRPVINVDWYDAIEFCNWRSAQEGLQEVYTIDKTRKDLNNQNDNDNKNWLVTCNWSASGYRLPTEAEWEYAAGGGKPQPDKWAGTNVPKDLSRYANYGQKVGKTASVGSYQANPLGLFDMSGNVWEWCWDWHQKAYPTIKQSNPQGPIQGEYHVLRGGSWYNSYSNVRAAYRGSGNPGGRNLNIGFRCLRAY